MEAEEDHFVYFTLHVGWKLLLESPANGYLQIACPESFPLSSNSFDVPLGKHESSREITVDTCVDNFFVDCALRSSFMFRLSLHSQNMISPETVLLDAGVLFLRDRKSVSVDAKMRGFAGITFTVTIDQDLLIERYLKMFRPTILYLDTIENIPKCGDAVPPFVKCKIGVREFNVIVNKEGKLDTAILTAPRSDDPVIFEIHDKEMSQPPVESFRGSGLLVPIGGASPAKGKRSSSRRHKSPRKSRHSNKDKNAEVPVEEREKEKEEELEQNVMITEPPQKITEPTKDKPRRKKRRDGERKSRRARDDVKYAEDRGKEETSAKAVDVIRTEANSPSRRYSPAASPVQAMAVSPAKETAVEIREPEPPKDEPGKEASPHKHRRKKKREGKGEANAEETSEEVPVPGFGLCRFKLLPERAIRSKVQASNPATSSDFSETVVVSEVFDPGRKYPVTKELRPIPRPAVTRQRPVPILLQEDDDDTENPAILRLEPPNSKFTRWILTCPRGANCSEDLMDFVHEHHHRIYRKESQQSFRCCVGSYPDIITGFHFLSPAEEVIVLEARVGERLKASRRLDELVRGFPAHVHVLSNTSHVFDAPRRYCCFDNLIKRVEIPIVMSEVLRVRGLYFHGHENNRLFPVVRKLKDLAESKTLIDADNSEAFPLYADMRILERRSNALYSTPLEAYLPAPAKAHEFGAHFGDEEPPAPPIRVRIPTPHDVTPVIEIPVVPVERERLTHYTLTRPQPGRSPVRPKSGASWNTQTASTGRQNAPDANHGTPRCAPDPREPATEPRRGPAARPGSSRRNMETPRTERGPRFRFRQIESLSG